MPIEKVFAMRATPASIFAAIERDLASAAAHAGDVYEVLERDPDRSIGLRVTMGGIPCRLRYTLDERDGTTEVTGTLAPYGWRYAVFRLMTFGLREHNFAVALVESLANLKAEVEGTNPDDLAPDPG